MRLLKLKFKAGLFFVLIAAALRAQVGTSGVTGVVEDATHSPIPGATITLTNADSGTRQTSITNPTGSYRFGSLIPGTYRIQAEASGFDTQVRSNVTLEVAQTLAIDVTLEVGQQTQSVNVEATSPLAETQSSSIAQLVGNKYIDNLPLPNRSANSLVSLSPGVVLIDSGSGAENYPVFSVAGGRVRNQNFTLDGGNVSNAVGLTRPQQLTSLPLDALQEFRVIANSYAAEFGHSTGGIVALSTRSGTNYVHGTLFEYLRNDAFDARNFFAATKPPLHLNQFGGSLGGPIRKDKTHFFMSWEQTREGFSDPTISGRFTVPTLAERKGDFSAPKATIYDPATLISGVKKPFAGNKIPASRFDPVAKAALSYWPLPNTPSMNGANNFVANATAALHRDIGVAKVDHRIGENDLLSVRYYMNDNAQQNFGAYGIPVADPNSNQTTGRIQSILGTETHTFTPSLLNQFQATFLTRSFIQSRFGAGENFAGKLGLTGVSKAAFPTFNLTGYSGLGSPGISNNSISRVQTPIHDTQIQDSMSWFKGRHAIKTGVEYRRGFNRESSDLSSSGNFTFTRQITDKPGSASNTGDSFASFLLGDANAANLNRNDVIPSHASLFSAYVQDDYRITDRLTINAGLRWEAELPRYVTGNRMNGFDRTAINPVSGTPGVVTFAGRNGVPRTAFDANYKNFGPRLGFAYNAPFLKGLVIRGGSGIYYGPNVSSSIGSAAALGFSDTASYAVSSADTNSALTLAGGFPAYSRPPLSSAYGAVPAGKKTTTSVTFFDRNRHSPVAYQFNLDLQKEVVPNVLVEAGYLGNVSHHLTANDLSINQVPDSLIGPGNTQLLRPFPQFTNVTLINPPVGDSTYHAIFVKAERRFASGFSFLAHYTFSKFIDDAASQDEFGDPGSYMDAYNRRLDKGLSGSDVPNRFVLTGLYEMPQFHDRHLTNLLLGRWQFGVLTTLQSGEPFTVYTSSNTTNAFPAGTLRPNLVGNPRLDSGRTLSHYFNTAAFAQPAPYNFGNSPRSVLRGPSSSNVDFTVSKNFPITERVKTELKGEFFNVFNIANFDTPGHTLGNSDFGAFSTARQARVVELALRIIF